MILRAAATRYSVYMGKSDKNNNVESTQAVDADNDLIDRLGRGGAGDDPLTKELAALRDDIRDDS